jgi:putative SOS response-associated peptidase YedK
MCGRYTYYNSKEILSEYKLEANEDLQQALDLSDNYNVAPGTLMPVIVRGEQAHVVELMEWGLIPVWSKPGGTPLKLINARQEGLLEKPMWKRLIKSHRCVVPAKGFYEWQKSGDNKQPYYMTPTKGDTLSFAGLWDEWTDPSGKKIKTYSIITTSPNKEMETIHNRMPAILNDEQMEAWLAPTDLNEDQVHQLLQPSPDGTLNKVKVSTDVNSVKNKSETLIYPLED